MIHGSVSNEFCTGITGDIYPIRTISGRAHDATPAQKLKAVDSGNKGRNNYCDMPQRRQDKTMTELLRRCLADASSLSAVERATGLKRQSMTKFLQGEQSLRLDLADKLAAHFGIECKRPKRKG